MLQLSRVKLNLLAVLYLYINILSFNLSCFFSTQHKTWMLWTKFIAHGNVGACARLKEYWWVHLGALLSFSNLVYLQVWLIYRIICFRHKMGTHITSRTCNWHFKIFLVITHNFRCNDWLLLIQNWTVSMVKVARTLSVRQIILSILAAIKFLNLKFIFRNKSLLTNILAWLIFPYLRLNLVVLKISVRQSQWGYLTWWFCRFIASWSLALYYLSWYNFSWILI